MAERENRSESDVEELVGVCAWCGAVRDPSGEWTPADRFVHDYKWLASTHTICPDCYDEQLQDAGGS